MSDRKKFIQSLLEGMGLPSTPEEAQVAIRVKNDTFKSLGINTEVKSLKFRDKRNPEVVTSGFHPDNAKEMETWHYWMTKDPKTGERYDIPLLSSLDPDYMDKYIYFMKLKEEDPATWERIVNWD